MEVVHLPRRQLNKCQSIFSSERYKSCI